MIPFIVALCLVLVHSFLEEKIDINLADEGFLWNGVIRTTKGKIPILDFKSYDPGRFYWSALWSKIFGLGIIGIRRSVSVFQFLGLWAGLTVVSFYSEEILYLIISGVVLILWMQPRHKRFEHAISLIGIYVGVLLMNTPSMLLFIVSGIFVGFSAFMGRNHGTYSFLSFLALIFAIFYFGHSNSYSNIAFWILGILIGYLPMILMWMLIPEMFSTYLFDKVKNITNRGTLNYVSLPFPWPWKIKRKNIFITLSDIFFSIYSILFFVLSLSSAVSIALFFPEHIKNPIFIAAVFGLFYFHHAWIRIDKPHLCQVSQPSLVLIIAFFSFLNSNALIVLSFSLLIASSLFVVAPLSPFMQKIYRPSDFIKFNLHGVTLWIEKKTSIFLHRIIDFFDQNANENDGVFIAPNLPTLYPILQRDTPVHSDYLLFPELDFKQEKMISDLKINNVRWAVINDMPLDGREELRFSNSHSIVWNFIKNEFEKVDASIGQDVTIYHRKDSKK